MKSIDILLSTYNGEQYIVEQLDSLFRQSNQDWRLIVRDDGSTDCTLEIISQYVKKYVNQIVLLEDGLGNLGPKLSFGKLLEYSKAPYVMFCDQDDVWLEDKVDVSLTKIQQMEKQFGLKIPTLVFSDSLITTQDLQHKGSLHEQMKLNLQSAVIFKNLILRNVIFGHSIMVNRVLLELALPMPANVYMHDWWVGIIAAAYGKIGYVPQATALYRQHQNNAYGYHSIAFWDCLIHFTDRYKKYMVHQGHVYQQIQAFTQCFEGDKLKVDDSLRVDIQHIFQLARLKQINPLERIFFLFKFYKHCPYKEKVLADMLFYYDIS